MGTDPAAAPSVPGLGPASDALVRASTPADAGNFDLIANLDLLRLAMVRFHLVTTIQLQKVFVRSYLEAIRDDPLTTKGYFEVDGCEFMWGAVGEFGTPPNGATLIELWSEDAPEQKINFRIWEVTAPDRILCNLWYNDLKGKVNAPAKA